jgi:hypothetical protein
VRASIFFLILVVFGKANAFDRLFCQGNLRNWIVTLSENNRTAVITPYKQSTTLTEQQSETLLVKNEKNEVVATLFPWNGLYVRANKALQKKYTISTSENTTGFEVVILDKPNSFSRRMSCRFTF